MRFVRIYAGNDERSHFEHRELSMGERGSTPVLASEQVRFAQLAPGVDMDWHHAPARQFVIVLGGRCEITIGNGEYRQFAPGDLFLAEDLSGQGHKFRELDGPLRLAFVPLLDGFDLDRWLAGERSTGPA